MFLMESESDRQLQASIQEEYDLKEHYSICETKTKLMNLNANNVNSSYQDCFLNGKALSTAEEYKHVGITRHSNLKIANK